MVRKNVKNMKKTNNNIYDNIYIINNNFTDFNSLKLRK